MACRRLLPVLFLPAFVVSCGAPPQPTLQIPTAPPAQATGIDGLYRGSSTRFQADRRDCPHPGLVDLAVQGGQFEYRWSPMVYVDATIGPDGSVQGAAADVTLSGRLDGDTLSGDVSSGTCGLHFTATRQG